MISFSDHGNERQTTNHSITWTSTKLDSAFIFYLVICAIMVLRG